MLSTFLTGLLLWFSSLATPVAGQTNPISTSSASPSTYNFEELTIPYLRNRAYDSQLGELTKQSENTSYTSYLTSFVSDGNRINALLNIPKGTPPQNGWPAVVFIHGYIPPERYQTIRNYSSYTDYPAKNGLAVFKIDLRGHGQSEGEPGGSYYSSDYVIDTLSAYVALQKSGRVDPEKVGLWGHSMAGNIVLRSIAVNSEIPKAVIWAGAGYTYDDLRQFRIQDTSYKPSPVGSKQQKYRKALFAEKGQFNSASDFWRQVPATNYLEEVDGFIQLHHAENDTVVNIGYSRNLKEILNQAGIENQLFVYISGGHNLTGSTFNSAIERTTNFLKQ